VPGQGVTYTIVASNVGPSTITGATVTDPMPAALTGVSWTCAGSAGGSCGSTSGSGDVGTTVNLPVGGMATFTVSATVAAAATGSLANTATVMPPAGATDPTPGNNAATDTDTLTPTADLSITKTDGQASAVPGQGVTYTIVASNAGPSAVTGAMVTDTMPAALTLVSWTCVGSAGGSCGSGSGSGDIGTTVDLPVGGMATFTVNATVAAGATGSLANSATVTAPAGVTDPTPGNNSATDTDTLTPTADLSITKTDGRATAVPGQGVTYTIVASNAGPSAVTGATVTDTMPATLTGASWTCAGAAGGSCGSASGSGDIGATVDLPVGGMATFTVNATVSPSATGTLSNTAAVTEPAGVTDPNPGDNSATDADALDLTGYYTFLACRLADTRIAAQGPALSANTTRTFQVSGLCGVPSDATAVAIVFAVVNESDLGRLNLYPTGDAPPLASSINFVINQTRTNNAVMALGTNGQIDVQCTMPPGSTGTTHFVLDVYGYFK